MKVVVETPKWSLSKFNFEGGEYMVEYRTPFPCLFNYGFVKHTLGDDGRPRDALVLGPRLQQGSEVEVEEVGTVHFMDDGLVDDKAVTSADGRITFLDKIRIHLFFTAYMLYKIGHIYVHEDRIARCRYHGLSLLPRAR